jgi:molybdopterin-binding protein
MRYICAVSTYRMGEAADLLGVSSDTLRRWADAGRIGATRTSGGHRLIDGAALAKLAVELASDQKAPRIARESVRNHFLGLVTEVTKDGVMAQVKLQAGPYQVVSLISREAADELALVPGMLAVAAIKATNVVIELPAVT